MEMIFIGKVVLWAIVTAVLTSMLVCWVSLQSDPTWNKLKPKGKIKYFILTIMKIEF